MHFEEGTYLFVGQECKDGDYCIGYLDIDCYEDHIQQECCQKCKNVVAKNPPSKQNIKLLLNLGPLHLS